eukprot:5927273-Prymnesium_polylepis.1
MKPRVQVLTQFGTDPVRSPKQRRLDFRRHVRRCRRTNSGESPQPAVSLCAHSATLYARVASTGRAATDCDADVRSLWQAR